MTILDSKYGLGIVFEIIAIVFFVYSYLFLLRKEYWRIIGKNCKNKPIDFFDFSSINMSNDKKEYSSVCKANKIPRRDRIISSIYLGLFVILLFSLFDF